MIICIILAWAATRKMEMIPKGLQNVMEMYVSGLDDFITGECGGDRSKALIIFPMIATFFLLILVCNYLGMIPGFLTPTTNYNVTLGLTAVSIFTYHALGIRFHGIKYIKHFMGAVPVMAPIFFPIEIFSHLGRIISLSIRLFGNMMSHDILLGILFMLAGPYLAPLPVMLVGCLACLLQAFIFMVLTIMYISMASEESH
jgi:F-type H+-transporting ATPase subunit a